MTKTHYMVRSSTNAKMIYCTDGDFHHEMQCGPGGFCAKLYKTSKGASAVRNGSVTVHACNSDGVDHA